jgi:hypothetical protein
MDWSETSATGLEAAASSVALTLALALTSAATTGSCWSSMGGVGAFDNGELLAAAGFLGVLERAMAR